MVHSSRPTPGGLDVYSIRVRNAAGMIVAELLEGMLRFPLPREVPIYEHASRAPELAKLDPSGTTVLRGHQILRIRDELERIQAAEEKSARACGLLLAMVATIQQGTGSQMEFIGD